MNKTLQEYYNEFAKEHKGTCKKKKTAIGIGGMNSWRIFIINIPYRNGELEFIISQASRMRIHYNFNVDLKLNFLLYHEDWMDKVAKLLGLKEYEIGIKDFDEMFIIKANSKEFVLKVLDEQICKYLMQNSLLSNFKLETISGVSKLELNALIQDTDLEKMEHAQKFMKKIVDNIYDFIENKYLK